MPIRRSLALTLALAMPAAAVQAGEIAYVDMQKVFEESALGKKLQGELRKDFEPKAAALGKEEQEIRRLQETLARDAALMSKDQLAKKEGEIKQRIEGYQKKAGALQQELAKVQQEKGPQVIGPARKAVDAVAKKKKVSMVVERGTAGLLYMDQALDITADVVSQMDANAK